MSSNRVAIDIVDTTVWIDYLKGRPTPQVLWLQRQMEQQVIGLNDLILCEVLQGIRGDVLFKQVEEDLSKFEIYGAITPNIAVAAAKNYRFLHGKGITVRTTIDCLIATFCLEGGHRLLHNDRDFDPFETHLGLRVIHP